MRNIALLEWGPASLYHLQPRERVKLRTPWLKDGPVMPPFLSTMEEAKAQTSEICIRYALSAFEDLNRTIRNLRRCFGFPYQEYIGYLNTLTRTHRVRREHELLIDRLRRWAIFGNVDAVVWIDYAKSNQPPGSFKIGPRDSLPFSKAHIHIVGELPNSKVENDEESEAWSEIEDDHMLGGTNGLPPALSSGASGDLATTAAPAHHGNSMIGLGGSSGSGRNSTSLGPGRKTQETYGKIAGRPLVRLARNSEVSRTASGKAGAPTRLAGEELPVPPSEGGGAEDAFSSAHSSPRSLQKKPQESTLLRSLLQEEVVPPHGSIYARTISPGPGYYSMAPMWQKQDSGSRFGHRPRGRIDTVIAEKKELPGPGYYDPKVPLVEGKAQLGLFGRAEKLVLPEELSKKLPFISPQAALAENRCVSSPPLFYPIAPEAPCSKVQPRAPKWSFGKSRRLW